MPQHEAVKALCTLNVRPTWFTRAAEFDCLLNQNLPASFGFMLRLIYLILFNCMCLNAMFIPDFRGYSDHRDGWLSKIIEAPSRMLLL